jgi:hypothetical protein
VIFATGVNEQGREKRFLTLRSANTADNEMPEKTSALAYAQSTNARFAHAGWLVLGENGMTLHEVGFGHADWFTHPVPLDYARRLRHLDAKRKCRYATQEAI